MLSMPSPHSSRGFHTASTRMFGLVNGDLFWAWDMAAEGRSLSTHASAELKRI